MRIKDIPERLNEISGIVLDAGIEVHRHFGPWLMESAYRDCLAHELRLRGLEVSVEHEMPLEYKSLIVQRAYRSDILVENSVIIELKTVPEILDEHEAQLMTYLHASGCQLGLLMNFRAPRLRDGFFRRALSPRSAKASASLRISAPSAGPG